MDGALFTLPEARPHDPDIDLWLAGRPPELQPMVREWVELIRGLGDDVTEIFHDQNATFCVGEAAFAYVGCYKAHVNIGFYLGAELDDPGRLLEGSGKRMRHVKVRPGFGLDAEALKALVVSAYEDIKARL
jgi:hypothetical protein